MFIKLYATQQLLKLADLLMESGEVEVPEVVRGAASVWPHVRSHCLQRETSSVHLGEIHTCT